MLGLDVNFFPLGELPDGIKQAIAAQIDQHQMASTASYHSMFTMFDELSKDQLMTLGGIFHILAQENAGLANYLEGITATYMRLKHDTCMGCGASHTPDFSESQDQADTPVSVPVIRDEPTAEEEAEYNVRLDKYNLEHHFDSGVMRFRCRGCGREYPTLEDRELRKPEDCSGCHEKAKWG